jgi:hypothetical protein
MTYTRNIHNYIAYIHTHSLSGKSSRQSHHRTHCPHTYIHTYTQGIPPGSHISSVTWSPSSHSLSTNIHTYIHTYIHTHTQGIPPGSHISSVTWSPCGSIMAFTILTESKGLRLYVLSPTDAVARPVASDYRLSSAFARPYEWSAQAGMYVCMCFCSYDECMYAGL